MSDKDEIKELFQKELGNYQAKVNPKLWNGIQAGIGNAAAGSASSMGLVSKIIIGASIVGAATVGTLFFVNNDNETPKIDLPITEKLEADSMEEEALIQAENKEEKPATASSENPNEEQITINSSTPQKNIEDPISDLPKEESQTIKSENAKEALSQETKLISNQEDFSAEESGSEQSPQLAPSSQKTEGDNAKIEKDEEFTTELNEVNIQVERQDNQYVSFVAHGIPEDAELYWEFGDRTTARHSNPEHFYNESGNYEVTLTVKTDREEVSKSKQVEIEILGAIERLPNVFTPNGDGENDEFFVNCKHINKFQLTIIDQNQNVVFSTNDQNFRWNGYDKSGKSLAAGTYYYIIIAEDESGNKINEYQELHLQR